MISRISAGEDDGCEEEEEQTITCQVCLDDLPVDDFPDPITVCCEHELNVCLSCLRQHIEVHIREDPVFTLACPTCLENITREDVQLWAEKDFFDE
jgi:hypothetical protein